MARAKKPARKGTKPHKSPFESLADVAKVAEECKRLIDQEIITIELRYPNEIRFRIDEDAYAGLGKTKEEDKRFRKVLRKEITVGLVGALTGDIMDALPPPPFWDVPSGKYAEYRKDAEAVRDKVAEILCDDELRSWYEIKANAKNPVLQSVEWEVNLKKADAGSGAVKDIPHAAVRFWTQKTGEKPDFSSAIQMVFFPGMRGTEGQECCILDMHERDVQNLIADLHKILAALRAIGPAKRGEPK